MRVLHVHNHYRSRLPSGENKVVEFERRELGSRGVDVVAFDAYNDDVEDASTLDKVRTVLNPITGGDQRRRVRDVLERQRPDLMHIHNVYPLISPRIIGEAKRRNIPVVHTVHNYRHGCMAGTLFRDGQPCRNCVDTKWPIAGLRHRCASDSMALSASMMLSQRFVSPLWKQADTIIAISDTVKDYLVEQGFQPDRIVVNYHGVPDRFEERPTIGEVRSSASGFVVASRLDASKGLLALLDAWERSGLDGRTRLTLIGDGELTAELRDRSARFASVALLGRLSFDELAEQFDQHAVIVVPSIWEEPFGLTAVEAMASGRPVLATTAGALAELVDDSVGWSVPPTVDGLARGLVMAHGASAQERADKGSAGRARYEATFRPEQSTMRLIDIYQSAVAGAPVAQTPRAEHVNAVKEAS